MCLAVPVGFDHDRQGPSRKNWDVTRKRPPVGASFFYRGRPKWQLVSLCCFFVAQCQQAMRDEISALPAMRADRAAAYSPGGGGECTLKIVRWEQH